MLFVVAGMSVVRVLLTIVGWVTFAALDRERTAAAYDNWDGAVRAGGLWSVPLALAHLTLLVLVIIWSWQAHRTVTSLGAAPRWRIGWTIGGWFACCAALVIPRLVLSSIERCALAPRSEGRARRVWDERPTLPIGWIWWIALIVSFVRVDATVADTGDRIADVLTVSGVITTSYAVGLVASIAGVVAALAGASYFWRLSQRLTPHGLAAHRDDQGP